MTDLGARDNLISEGDLRLENRGRRIRLADSEVDSNSERASSESSEPVQTHPFRWWFLPSWFGLDAPVVVSSWAILIAMNTDDSKAAVAGFALPPRITIVALFLAVWSIYLLDRIVDVARCKTWDNVTGRMRFGRDFDWLFKLLWITVTIGLGFTVFSSDFPTNVWWRGIIIGVGMTAYVALFVVPESSRKFRGKEIFVGLFFSLGGFAVLDNRVGSLSMLFGVWLVVAMNCLIIASRESDTDALIDLSGASQWWGNIDRDLRWISFAFTVLCLLAWFILGNSVYAALFIAFGLLLFLHVNATRLSADAVRALADFCILSPLAFIASEWLLA